MTDTYPYDEPLSHPPDGTSDGVRLVDHLSEVSRRTAAVCPDTETPHGTPLPHLARIVGLLHDFGKLTTYFQQYIAGTHPGNQQTHHSQLGAAVALYVISEDEAFDVTDALIAFTAIAKHHGHLPNVVEYAVEPPNAFFERYEAHLQQQAENIQANAPELAQSIINRTGTSATFKGFQTALSDGTLNVPLTDEYVGLMFSTGGNDPPAAAHDALLALWSSLLLGDKSAAAGIPMEALHTEPFDPHDIETRINTLWEESKEWDSELYRLNVARNTARQTAIETSRTLPVDGAVATLTLPTGLGKTFAGTQAALEHLHRKRSAGYSGRLVYALPFTSVIDQTETVFTDVFDADPTSDELTVHHHLSETVTRHDPETDTDAFAERDYLLGETWRAGAVLTTYVQLLESLVGPTNRQAIKLPALTGSVVLLDEPQSLPTDWWPLFRRLTTVLTDQFNATVILMTATQPRILDDSFEPTELVPDANSYFEAFERVSYRLDPSVSADSDLLSIRDAGEQVATTVDEGASSVLSITNTIDSTRHLYEAALASLDTTHETIEVAVHYAEQIEKGASDPVVETVASIQDAATEESVVICQLTTRHTPRDRKRLLEIITRLLDSPLSVVLCSTQLVEAGVDISFETVFRDLAPIDALVQAAGRCNRSFEWEQGLVTIWHLEPDEDWKTTPAEAVYGRGFNRIYRTQETLCDLKSSDNGVLPEAVISTKGVRDYYTRINSSSPGNERYVEQFDSLDCDDLQSVSLIKTRESVDAIVLRSPDDRDRAEQLCRALEAADYRKASRLITELAPLRVSLPTPTERHRNLLDSLPTPYADETDSDLRLLDVGRFPNYFDMTSGVQVPVPK